MKNNDNYDIEQRKKFLEKLATMYYINDKSQQEIADQLDIGRSSVARFLAEAKELGVVKIEINTGVLEFRNKVFEQELKDKYVLKDCFVLNRHSQGAEEIILEYLDTIIPLKGNIGVGGGTTLHELSKSAWRLTPRPQANVIQMMGSLGANPETGVAKQWADAFGSNGMYITAPLLVESTQIKNTFMTSFLIRETIELLNTVDTCIVGIGASGLTDRLKYLNLPTSIIYESKEDKSIGDISFHFFDNNGIYCSEEVSQKAIGITHEQYQKIPNKIAIAYGAHKAKAVEAALKANLIDILVTDYDLVTTLVERE